MSRTFAALLLASLTWPAWGQVVVHGRVVDSATHEPLAFVHVVAEGVREGATSDIDGRFALEVAGLPVNLRFSYVGYAPLPYTVVNATAPLEITMDRMAVDLAMVEVRPGENPAHRIIDRVRANRTRNDALRNRPNQYTSYSKTIFTAAVDSAVLSDPERYAALDSSDRNAIEWLEEQHLLLIESATKRSFIPPAAEKEEVLAMRVSGLKDPSLLAMVASTKTFSLYEPQISLGGDRTYLSPLGPNGTERYLFLLEDTLYQGRDTVFILTYRPRTGRKFDGLRGQLHVHTDGYALQHVIAEPAEDRSKGMSAKLQQRYIKVPVWDGLDSAITWFPDQLNTFLYFNFASVNSMQVIGVGRTYLKDISVDADLRRRDVRGPEFVMEPMALRRDEQYWQALRTDSLDARELRTYQVIDSVSQEEGLERKLRWLGYLATGHAPLGPVDVLLDKVLRYNGYEGLRLGLGLVTNDRITRHASLGGYFAYGFRDKEWKYGGDLSIKPWAAHGPQLRLYHEHDVEESGGVQFRGSSRVLDSEAFRWLYVDRMDRLQRTGGELLFRMGSPLRVWLGSARIDRWNLLGYQYADPQGEGITLLHDRFVIGEVSIGLRYAYREQVAQLPHQMFGLGTRWPVLYVHATRMVSGLWGGEWDLWRCSAMLEKTFRLRMVGDLSVRLMGGVTQPDAPYPFLFNLRGTMPPGFGVAVRNTFETMRPNEFAADRLLVLHLRHSFGDLLMKPKGRFAPVPSLVFSAGVGELEHPDRHRRFDVNAPDQGFAEAGLQVDRLVRMGLCRFGVGAYHRLGAYMHGDLSEDLMVKLTVEMGL